VDAKAGIRAGGDIRANVNSALDGRLNSPIRSNVRTGADARANLPGVGRVDGRADGRANVDGRGRVDVDGRANVDGRVRTNVDGRSRVDDFLDLRGRTGVDARAGVNARSAIRPSWFNSRLGVNSRLNTNLNRTIGAALTGAVAANYLDRHPNRNGYWGGYGRPVRNYWGRNNYPYFNNRWWAGHYVYRPYSYFNYWGARPWGYWWGSPGWVGVNRWYGGWGGWNSPYYYDYGVGGNVVYRDNYVYVDGTNVGTTEEYAQSAAALATVDPNEVPATDAAEWLGLGTFAITETADDASQREQVEPTRFVQLAVDKKGFVTGTLFNRKTDEVYSLSGRVDKETQRVAFSVDNDRDIVFETGLYNLTQEETPVLVHLGPNKTETFVFVRLDQPEGQDAAPQGGSIEQLP
jgi:hypothetical protein